jgi:hypothetical protein
MLSAPQDQTSFARTDGDINFNNDTNNPLNTGHPYSNALLGIYNSYQQASNFVKAPVLEYRRLRAGQLEVYPKIDL